MAASTTIRVSVATRDAINRVRAQTGESADSILKQALAAYQESLFWRRWQETYDTSGCDPHSPLLDDDMALWDAVSAQDLNAADALTQTPPAE